ncbi:unnamed protein product [Rhizophagus irregularis]|uniref:F-box domain-containing protein n=1 Tax=Rhizophagus irregularis TaxID=588596 RepID=A0A2N1NG84_9GLOM|nr:hypothetical protein RhiirC2_776624 [Rhizophagus irregularis]CAB4380937.1 unnamed protein product [Rhizophagus irregularis]CAB5347736.1 unnamed protein product [Rhizophagus irregularis]
MTCHIPADCLDEIFEHLYLEKDKFTNLYTCLLVNRLWCEVSIRILWRNIWSLKHNFYVLKESTKLISILTACLPDESKDLLRENDIFISTSISKDLKRMNGVYITTPTSKQPLFNYISFCKVLSIGKIDMMIKKFFENQQSSINSRDSNNYHKADLVTQEILKMFMNRITSLKKLSYRTFVIDHRKGITFTNFPRSRECLMDLSELSSDSDIHSEFFYQLSQICHNIQSINIIFEKAVSNGLKKLISSQNNLKYLSLYQNHNCIGWEELIPYLTKHSNTLIRLKINGNDSGPFSFITIFTNLRELILSTNYDNTFKGFNDLQYVTFTHLHTLEFHHGCPKVDVLIKLLENNGKNLKTFVADIPDKYTDILNNAINKFCPKFKTNILG